MKKLVANVTFENSVLAQNPFADVKTYRFFTDIENLVANDRVVVDTVNGLQLATFESYSGMFGDAEAFNNKQPRWIIQKVDLDAHNKRIEAAEKLKQLKKKMEAERAKAQELEVYEILAKNNPEMAALLQEFKTLQGDV